MGPKESELAPPLIGNWLWLAWGRAAPDALLRFSIPDGEERDLAARLADVDIKYLSFVLDFEETGPVGVRMRR